VLPVSGLDRLAAAVGQVTAGLGPVEDRPFRGHLTLARARRRGGLHGLPAPDLGGEWPVDWTVEEVAAFSSVLRPEGAEHRLLDRWPLGPR
jgi:2'-5' RNA ligase